MSSPGTSLEATEEQRHWTDKRTQATGRRTAKQRFQEVLEEGHAAAGFTICVALSVGLILGFACPRDHNIPGAPYLNVQERVP